jgi:hypothetical protein
MRGNQAHRIPSSPLLREEETTDLPFSAAVFSIPEAARLLGLPERTLRDRAKKCKFPSIRTDRGYQVSASVVTALRNERRRRELRLSTLEGFGTAEPPPGPVVDPEVETLRAQVESLQTEVAALREQRDGARRAASVAITRMRQTQRELGEAVARAKDETDTTAKRIIDLRSVADYQRRQIDQSREEREHLRALLEQTLLALRPAPTIEEPAAPSGPDVPAPEPPAAVSVPAVVSAMLADAEAGRDFRPWWKRWEPRD